MVGAYEQALGGFFVLNLGFVVLDMVYWKVCASYCFCLIEE